MRDLRRLERLGQIIERPALDRQHRGLDRRVGRDHDDGQPGRKPKQVGQKIEPVFRAEPDVEEGDLEAFLPQMFFRRRAVGRGLDAMSRRLQGDTQRLANAEIIIDDEDIHRPECKPSGYFSATGLP